MTVKAALAEGRLAERSPKPRASGADGLQLRADCGKCECLGRRRSASVL